MKNLAVQADHPPFKRSLQFNSQSAEQLHKVASGDNQLYTSARVQGFIQKESVYMFNDC